MKNFKKQILGFALFLTATTFVSCSKDDDATGDSTLEVTEVRGTVNLVAPLLATQNVNEANAQIFTYTITIDKPQAVDIVVRAEQISGTATMGADYEIEPVTIPAYSTTATGKIKILDDLDIEGIETFTLQISTSSTSNVTIPAKTVSFTINNNLSTDLDLTFNFNKVFSITGVPFNLYSTPANGGFGYDMDFYIYDASFTDTGVYDAATGATPEHISISPADFVDGTYHVIFDIFDDGGLSTTFHDPFVVPITVDYERQGGINHATFVQEASFAPMSTAGTGNGYVVSFIKAGGVYTLQNSLSQTIASGRGINWSAKIAQSRANRNKSRK